MRIRASILGFGFLVIAACLAFGLLQQRTNFIVWHPDGTSTRTFQQDPVLTSGRDFIDTACLAGIPCNVSGVTVDHGIYPRDRVPWFVALTGGVVLPYTLVCIGVFLLCEQASGITRIILACSMAMVSAVLLTPGGLIAYRAVRYSRIEYPDLNGALLAASVLGATAAAGASWLFISRPPRKRTLLGTSMRNFSN